MSAREALAAHAGILAEYADVSGARHHLSEDTRTALLAALGLPADDEATAAATWDALRTRAAARALSPTRVVARGTGVPTVRAGATPGAEATYALTLRREGERDAVLVAEGHARADAHGGFDLRLDGVELPLGYHHLHLAIEDAKARREGTQHLIVVPDRCPSPADLLGGARVLGLTANLYTVRSARNWGVGDLGDLRALVEFAAGAGMAFVGVNPLHALRNADGDISPYSPISRLYRNVLYLDVSALLAAIDAPEARALADGAHARIAALRAASHVDYAEVMACKRPVLEALHRAFAAGAGGAGRHEAYTDWRLAQGEPLERFATFVALDEHFRPQGCGWWPEWPPDVRTPDGAGIEAFRAAHAERIDFHRWCQFELDAQLGRAAALAAARGLPIGLYEDLAIGAAPASSDVWSAPDVFLRGVSIGAPPDPLGPEGQNWGLPPMNPHRLRERGYDLWVALVRNALRHAGALRIDHVLGLFRQFWIPEGMRGRDGAYVRFPADDLLGILALEATRARALVVGEDLGTVPVEVPPAMQRWGVLSSKVLVFERELDGSFRDASAYPTGSLATANTHDLAPFAGWWRGRDVEIRREVGLIPDDASAERARAERARERTLLVQRLVAAGVLDASALDVDPGSLDDAQVRAAVHVFLRRTPAALVGLSLDDLVGETVPVNVPGVGPDRFPTWTRRLATPVEALGADPGVRHALGVERAWWPADTVRLDARRGPAGEGQAG